MSRILYALAIVVIADAVVAQRPSSSINIPIETYTMPIEAPLKATNIAPIAYLDIEGAPKTQ